MNIDAEAMNCMAQGKRHLLVHDYNSAVQCLEEACKLYDSKYGISADECADAYLNYGYALLELHRQETGALDGLVDTKQQGSDDEDDEELDDEETDLKDEEADSKDEDKSTVETAAEANGKTNNEEDISVSPTPAPQVEEVAAATANGSSTNDVQPATSSSNGNSSLATDDKQSMETDADPNQPSTSTGITDDNRAEDEDDSAPNNIEVAFEVLTMAKNIYQRQTEYRDDAFLKLSDALQKLGEILIEWENNEEALKDLGECLEIRKRHLPDDDRLIAEVYYHIGLTHSLNSNITEANVQFQKAVDVIEQRLNKLKSSYTSTVDGAIREKIENEIKELDYVLPEMKSRIEDNQDQLSTSKLASVAEEDEKLEEEKIAEKKKQILAKPISNVTHLVKRKREEPAELDSNKKLKNGNENGSNGSTSNVEMKDE